MNCIKCGAKASRTYSPDLDIKGIGMCKEHEEEIMLDLLIANYEGWEKFERKYTKKSNSEK